MAVRTLAIVGRHGDDGGRYLSPNQWKELKIAAWRLHRNGGGPVQVWRATQGGELIGYDSEATQRVTDYIVKAAAALKEVAK